MVYGCSETANSFAFAKEMMYLSVAGEFAFVNDVFSMCEILLELLICNKRLHKGYHHVFLPFSGSEYSYRQPSRTIVNNLGALWEILR